MQVTGRPGGTVLPAGWWSSVRRLVTGPVARPYLVLVAVATLPLLWTRPGRVSGDASDRILLDPAGALASAATQWDGGVAFGVLRDRTYGEAFPMAPFYAVADALGMPAWLTERLWLAVLLVAAGAGVVALLRSMKWDGPGVLAAALVYQLSPYALTSMGTRSVVLLAWAGLPWLLTATAAALEDRPGGGDWRYPARFAVVVALVGSANLSAFLYVAVGPALWILYSVAAVRDVPWRRGLGVAARLAGASALVLAWRLVALALRPVAELDAVVMNDPAALVALGTGPTRTLRGLGDWATSGLAEGTAGEVYLGQVIPVLASFVLPGFGLLALAQQRFHNRVFFVILVVAGMATGVGMAPAESPEAYGRLLDALVGERVGMLLAPTARALPLVMLGLAVGVGAGIRDLAERLPARERWIELSVLVPALLSVPSFAVGRSLDGPLLRDEIAQHWLDAAAAIDGPEHDGFAVLELPGLEVPQYSWGRTVEPISFTLIDRTVALRTGTMALQPATADLLAAIDGAARIGRLQAEAIAPLARLMGVDTIVVRGDTPTADDPGQELARSLRELLDDAPGIGERRDFGALIDDLPELSVYPVLDPEPMVRLTDRTDTVVMSGTGAGLVSLANEGVLRGGEAVIYSASLSAEDFDLLPDDVPVIVTDASRWFDMDEVGLDPAAAALETSFASARIIRSDREGPLDVAVPDAYSVLRYSGGVVDIGSSGYGAVDRVLPQFRPGNAFDGDVGTAWVTGIDGDPVGDRLRIDLRRPLGTSRINLRQADPLDGYVPITRIRLVDLDPPDGEPPHHQEVAMLDSSTQAQGQDVTLDDDLQRTTALAIEIVEVQRHGADFPGSGFAEIRLGELTVAEHVSVPSDVDRFDGTSAHPMAFVFERWGSAAGLFQEPERRIARRFVVDAPRTFDVVVSVRGRDIDAPLDTTCVSESVLLTVDDQPVPLVAARAARAERGTYELRGDALELDARPHHLQTALPENACGLTVERVVLTDGVGPIAGPEAPGPQASLDVGGGTSVQVTVGRLPGPMWLTLGASYDRDWLGRSLGGDAPATLLNGHAAAWLLPSGTNSAFRFDARWTPQRPINVGVIVSTAALLVVLVLAVIPMRRRMRLSLGPPVVERTRSASPNVIVLAVLAIFGVAAGPVPALAAGAVALALEQRPQLRRRVAWIPALLLLVVAVASAVRTGVSGPFRTYSELTEPLWVEVTTWTAVAVAVTVALANTERPPVRRYTP